MPRHTPGITFNMPRDQAMATAARADRARGFRLRRL